MQIDVKWFKESGKYYSSGLVEIGDTHIWKDGLKQAIVDNQAVLMDGWQEHDFYVVTNATCEQDADPTFKGFYTHLYTPADFRGIKKNPQ